MQFSDAAYGSDLGAAARSLFPLIEQVNNERVPVEINSRRADAVLISRADYEALEDRRDTYRPLYQRRR